MSLGALQAERTKLQVLRGVLHHVENCVQSHCPQQQVAMKGGRGPHCDCLAAGERSLRRQGSDSLTFCCECHKVN